MRYRWTASPATVAFKRVSNRWILLLALVVGLVIGGVGALGIFGRVEPDATRAIFLQMLFAMGAMFVVVAIKGLVSGDRYDPVEIVFDGTRGLVHLRDAGGGSAIAIPFGDVRGFDVRAKSLPSSQGATGVSGQAYHYFAVAQTAAGSFEVVQSHSREEPERAIAAMRGCVATTRSTRAGSAASPPAVLPAKLTATSDGDKTTLRWRNAAVGPLVFFLFVVSCLVFVLSRFALIFMNEGPGAIVYPVMGFFVLVLLFIVGTNVHRMVRDLRNTYEIVVGPSGLRYSEYPAGKVVELAAADIGRIVFEHQIGEQPTPIRVLGPDPAETERARFDVAALSATERAMLASYCLVKTRTVFPSG